MRSDLAFLDTVRQTARVVSRALEANIADHGVSLGQWRILLALCEADGLTPSELSRHIGIATPTTVNAIDGMERHGLVARARNATDRRKVNINLTPKGRALRRVLPDCLAELTGRAIHDVAPADLTAALRVLNQVRANLVPVESEFTPDDPAHNDLAHDTPGADVTPLAALDA